MNINDLPSNPEEFDAYEQALDNAELDHMEQMDADEQDYPEDNLSDVEADSMALDSCGWGSDESYGGDHDCGGDW